MSVVNTTLLIVIALLVLLCVLLMVTLYLIKRGHNYLQIAVVKGPKTNAVTDCTHVWGRIDDAWRCIHCNKKHLDNFN